MRCHPAANFGQLEITAFTSSGTYQELCDRNIGMLGQFPSDSFPMHRMFNCIVIVRDFNSRHRMHKQLRPVHTVCSLDISLGRRRDNQPGTHCMIFSNATLSAASSGNMACRTKSLNICACLSFSCSRFRTSSASILTRSRSLRTLMRYCECEQALNDSRSQRQINVFR